MSSPLALPFIAAAIRKGVIQFGNYTTNAGRESPYSFNINALCDGDGLAQIGGYYAEALLDTGAIKQGDKFALFGPAYKAIFLAAATAIALSEKGHNVGVASARKEAKDHGEGGLAVGSPIEKGDKVWIVDDVLSAGKSTKQALDFLRAAGANPVGVLVALDRQELEEEGTRLAAQAITEDNHIPVIAIATLWDLLFYLHENKDQDLLFYLDKNKGPNYADSITAIQKYRKTYGMPTLSGPWDP